MRFGFAVPAYGPTPTAQRSGTSAGRRRRSRLRLRVVPRPHRRARLRDRRESDAAVPRATGDLRMGPRSHQAPPHGHRRAGGPVPASAARRRHDRDPRSTGRGPTGPRGGHRLPARGVRTARADPYEKRGEVTDEFLRSQRSAPEGYSVVSAPTPVPIWVGGNAKAAQGRAALLGDGWHPLWMPDQRVRRGPPADPGHAGHGRPDRAVHLLLQLRCHAAARPIAGVVAPPPARAPRGSEFRYAPESWVDADNRPRFVGNADQLVADFRLLEAAGVDHVTLRFGSTEVGDLERFAADVRPAFDP